MSEIRELRDHWRTMDERSNGLHSDDRDQPLRHDPEDEVYGAHRFTRAREIRDDEPQEKAA